MNVETVCSCETPNPQIPDGSADADCGTCGNPYVAAERYRALLESYERERIADTVDPYGRL